MEAYFSCNWDLLRSAFTGSRAPGFGRGMGGGDDTVGDGEVRPQLAMADFTSITWVSLVSSSSSPFGSSIGAGVEGLEEVAPDLPQFAMTERTSIGVETSGSSVAIRMAGEAAVWIGEG